MTEKTPLQARDQKFLWHPCTQMKDLEETPPLCIERGEGIYLYDQQGKRYLDAISSWWVNLFGHNHPLLNQALDSQMKKISHVMFAGVTHEPAVDLAEKLVQNTPENLSRVFYSDNGSTSIEVALKLSLQYWLQSGKKNKTRFMHLKGGYHGETLGALAVCGLPVFRQKFESVLMESLEVAGPDCTRCPFDLKRDSCNAECFGPMSEALEKFSDQTAAVIIEPLVQGAAGMKIYPPVYLKKLEEACERFGVHLIFDEVAVGFGRTGHLFVSQGLGVKPDFLCLSKGVTSGYLPLAVTMTEENIFKAFYGDPAECKLFIHSHSYSANPLACSVANKTMDMLTEPDFLAGLKPAMESMNTMADACLENEWCGEFRSIGMIAAIELVKNSKTLEPFPASERIGYQIFKEAIKNGLLLRPLGDVVYFIPPLVIKPQEYRDLVVKSIECIKKVIENR